MITLLSIPFVLTSRAQQTPEDSLKNDTVSLSWSFAAAAYYYILPAEKNRTTVVGYADHRSLHLEARYNYEGLKTGSVFGGYMLETGNKLKVTLTPMIGFVFGNTIGMAPGLEGSLSWKKFDFYSETEYVLDLDGKESNFLYTWTELAISPFRNLRTGISANRTRLFESDLEVQKGIFVQYSFWKLTAGVHYFNPFSNDDFAIATLGVEF